MPTNVVIGRIDADTPTKFSSSQDLQAIYTDYMVHNRYEKDGQKWMLPVASPSGFAGDSTAFVQLAALTLLWIADWTACRYKILPDIPDPDAVDPGWVLLDDHWELASVTVGADGALPLYRIEGTYIYGCKNPSAATINNLSFPKPPWLQDSVIRTVSPGSLKSSILMKTKGSIGGGTIRIP